MKITVPTPLKSIHDNPPPLGTLIWVTDGLMNWARAQKLANGNWNVKTLEEDDFDFDYWCPLEERYSKKVKVDTITSFKKWYEKNS